MSTLDIIVPCYAYGRFLRECVSSVLAQSFAATRVLIIDDDSPDDTASVAAALAREDDRVSVIRHGANQGHIATYNEGIAWASGDYLLLLSADDFLVPGALELAVGFLDSHPEVGLVHGGCPSCGESGLSRLPRADPAGRWEICRGEDFIAAVAATTVNPVATPTVIVRTDLQKRLGGYRPELPHSGDLEMWMRFAAHGAIARFDQPLAVRRFHGRNMSQPYHAAILHDYLQRELALELFFQRFEAALPRGRQLHRKARRSLAERMFWTGISQLCRGNRALGRRLLSRAFALCPSLRFRPPILTLVGTAQAGRIGSAVGALASRLRRTLVL
jgi:glycosyltransferase involved in cell wall biosynthesis